jgi:hypothetical protein
MNLNIWKVGCRGGAAAVGGARRRSAGLDCRGGPVVLGWILAAPSFLDEYHYTSGTLVPYDIIV